MAQEQIRSPANAPVRCVLEFSRGQLDVSVERQGRLVDKIATDEVSLARLEELRWEHQSAFEVSWQPGPIEQWASATEKFLAEVDRLIGERIRPLLAPYQRVALELENPVLARLPIETAHQPGSAALFELLQVYRPGHRPELQVARRRRQFTIEISRSCADRLPAVFAEEAVVCSLHRSDRAPDSERLVHVLGHHPTIDGRRFARSERAHLVLSGCDSLPDALPDGVASATGTLWPVDDQTNAVTVSLLHSRLAMGIGPVEALRQTQLLQRRMPAVVWAAYAHIGQPD